jgi:hypothetical protein
VGFVLCHDAKVHPHFWPCRVLRSGHLDHTRNAHVRVRELGVDASERAGGFVSRQVLGHRDDESILLVPVQRRLIDEEH